MRKLRASRTQWQCDTYQSCCLSLISRRRHSCCAGSWRWQDDQRLRLWKYRCALAKKEEELLVTANSRVVLFPEPTLLRESTGPRTWPITRKLRASLSRDGAMTRNLPNLLLDIVILASWSLLNWLLATAGPTILSSKIQTPTILWERTAPCTLPITRKVESQQGRTNTEPTKRVIGHCYPGIPAELVIGDARANDYLLKNTDGALARKENNELTYLISCHMNTGYIWAETYTRNHLFLRSNKWILGAVKVELEFLQFWGGIKNVDVINGKVLVI